MECCGVPFAEGDVVDWNLARGADDEWLTVIAGAELASRVTHQEDHHDLLGDARRHRGRVLSIRSVYGHFAPRPGGDDGIIYPVAGSAELVAVKRVDGGESDGGDLLFLGYLVELELAHGSS